MQDLEGNTPLMSAIFSSYEIVKMLLECGADPNIRDNFESSPLEIACV